MRLNRWPMLLLFLVGIPLAQAQTADLRLRWEAGSTTAYTIEETMHQVISGTDVQTDLHWTRRISYTQRVLFTAVGSARIEQAFTALEISVSRDGKTPIRYDSANPDPAAATDMMIAPFTALPGSKISYLIDGKGKVTELEGATETLDTLLDPLTSGPLLDGLKAFSQAPDREARLAAQIEQSLRVIPGRAVRRGDRWPVEIDHVTPIAGQISTDLTATLKSISRTSSEADITLEGKLTQSADDEPTFSALLGITLDAGTIEGSIGFDEEKGRIVTSTMNLSTAWSMKGLTENPTTQTIRQSSTLRLVP